MTLTKIKTKKFDVHLTNISGLGASSLIRSLAPALVQKYFKRIDTILIPDSKELNFLYDIKNINIIKYKRYLSNSISRFLEIIFLESKNDSASSLVLGDMPLRLIPKQVIFLHNTLIIQDFPEQDFFQRIKFKILRVLFSINTSKISAVIVQTKVMKDLVIKKYPKFNSKVFILHLPPPDIFIPYKNARKNKKRAKKSSSLSIFYPSSFYSHKNHIFLSSLRSNFSSINELILTIDQASNPAPHAEYVKCVGVIHAKDTLAYYLEVDALVFFSLTESFGLPILEAMWIGLPIIVPDLPYARYLCGDEAIYFDPYEFKTFEEAVNFLIKKLNSGWHPDWSNHIKKFPSDWDAVASSFVNIIDSHT
jgi:hypothetical protein